MPPPLSLGDGKSSKTYASDLRQKSFDFNQLTPEARKVAAIPWAIRASVEKLG